LTRRGTPRFYHVSSLFSTTFACFSNTSAFPECTFPLTGPRCVWKIITDLAVFDVSPIEGLTLKEIADGVTVDEVTSKTAAPFKVADDLKPML
jgi:3-oxoacid CoA-transferase